MKLELYKADSRGHYDHGWLNTNHTFSFASYYNPDRMNFGVLRVINDDVVQGGKGFGTHPHHNVEIISIPIYGSLEHGDSMGNKHVITTGEVQVMSAGSGLTHNEYNGSKTEAVNFFQIWIQPNEEGVEPRYDQNFFDMDTLDAIQLVVSPDGEKDSLWIHQDAWISIGRFSKGKESTYKLHNKKYGVFVMVIEGEFTVAGEELSLRDGLGIENVAEIAIKAKSEKARILLIEVPMEE